MDAFLTWLTASGERITVITLLLIVIFVIIYGVQKKQRWWVPGWMLTQCEEDKAELRKEVKSYVDRTQNRLDVLENIEDQRTTDRRRGY